MKNRFKVHRVDVDMESGQQRLENFLNGLQGDVVSIIPHASRLSLARIFGLKNQVDFLFIIEKL